MNANNLKNKKILVTGGAGFIGSHLTNRLVNLGARVSVIVKYNSIIDNPRLVKIWDNINVIEADLRNTDSVREMKKMSFDLTFHLAAYNHVGDSFKHVLENVNSNLISTINLLNNGPKIKKVIHMGTSEIYGIQTKLPFNVKEVPNPMSPYAVTKYASFDGVEELGANNDIYLFYQENKDAFSATGLQSDDPIRNKNITRLLKLFFMFGCALEKRMKGISG